MRHLQHLLSAQRWADGITMWPNAVGTFNRPLALCRIMYYFYILYFILYAIVHITIKMCFYILAVITHIKQKWELKDKIYMNVDGTSLYRITHKYHSKRGQC